MSEESLYVEDPRGTDGTQGPDGCISWLWRVVTPGLHFGLGTSMGHTSSVPLFTVATSDVFLPSRVGRREGRGREVSTWSGTEDGPMSLVCGLTGEKWEDWSGDEEREGK